MTHPTLPELDEFDRLIEAGGPRLEVRTLCEVNHDRLRLPVRAVLLGNPAERVPAVGFFGGVHGLERIGTHVVLSFLGSIVERLGRDERLERLLEGVRLVFMPLVNPAGMSQIRRSNGNGVDLMRNAPLQSRERVAFLLGGQRLSPLLPWYRGARRAPMETESEALCALVRSELLPRPFSLALDCHSGFGLRDRIWFPHAHTRDPFARLAEVHALVSRFVAAHPRNDYLFEPQSRRYLTHGDLWDYLYAEADADGGTFLPLTLEMGSWRWVRKSPSQILSRIGLFNPLPPARAERVRRNHLDWLRFLCDAARRHADWLPAGEARERHRREALESWYGAPA